MYMECHRLAVPLLFSAALLSYYYNPDGFSGFDEIAYLCHFVASLLFCFISSATCLDGIFKATVHVFQHNLVLMTVFISIVAVALDIVHFSKDGNKSPAVLLNILSLVYLSGANVAGARSSLTQRERGRVCPLFLSRGNENEDEDENAEFPLAYNPPVQNQAVQNGF